MELLLFFLSLLQSTVSSQAANASYTDPHHDDFFAVPLAKFWYKAYIMAVLNRINTLTGVAYKDKPQIAAWEL